MNDDGDYDRKKAEYPRSVNDEKDILYYPLPNSPTAKWLDHISIEQDKRQGLTVVFYLREFAEASEETQALVREKITHLKKLDPSLKIRSEARDITNELLTHALGEEDAIHFLAGNNIRSILAQSGIPKTMAQAIMRDIKALQSEKRK